MAFPIPIVDTIVSIGGKLIDRLIPNPEAKAAAILELRRLEQTGELAQLAAETQLAMGQIEVNKVEAASGNLFVSGWRPGVGWVCVAALASQYVIGPLFEWITGLIGERITWPIMNTGELMTLLFGMLGLSTLRTAEKIKGVKPPGT